MLTRMMMISLLFVFFSIAGKWDFEDQQVQDQVWVIICENDERGVYSVSYVSPEPYDYIEEVHLCDE